ncbi:hypothetical protein TNCV_1457971 [Trichonephila clavipes]|nr:hypothetical protein TNCV_1457971 [Trichonephila clavipes]
MDDVAAVQSPPNVDEQQSQFVWPQRLDTPNLSDCQIGKKSNGLFPRKPGIGYWDIISHPELTPDWVLELMPWNGQMQEQRRFQIRRFTLGSMGPREVLPCVAQRRITSAHNRERNEMKGGSKSKLIANRGNPAL